MQSVLDGLEEALERFGTIHKGNADIPPNTRVVDGFAWKDIVFSDTKLSPDAKDDSQRRAFSRIARELLNEKLICTDGNDLIWLPEKTG